MLTGCAATPAEYALPKKSGAAMNNASPNKDARKVISSRAAREYFLIKYVGQLRGNVRLGGAVRDGGI
jgi:hypothetical protein